MRALNAQYSGLVMNLISWGERNFEHHFLSQSSSAPRSRFFFARAFGAREVSVTIFRPVSTKKGTLRTSVWSAYSSVFGVFYFSAMTCALDVWESTKFGMNCPHDVLTWSKFLKNVEFPLKNAFEEVRRDDTVLSRHTSRGNEVVAGGVSAALVAKRPFTCRLDKFESQGAIFLAVVKVKKR